MSTVKELRRALQVWGFPGDLERFDAELGGADLDDLAAVREIVQAYRHRVILRQTPDAMAATMMPTEEVAEVMRRKMAENPAAGR